MQRIRSDVHVLNGQPCIAGTDITVDAVIALLESVCSARRIRFAHYPEITAADVRACLRYAERRRRGEERRIVDPISLPYYRPGFWIAFGFPLAMVVMLSGSIALLLRGGGTPARAASPAQTAAAPPTVLPPPAPAPSVSSATDITVMARGDAAYAAGDFRAAERAYAAAVESNPNDCAAINNLGLAYYRQNRLADAEVQYRRAIELDPSDATGHSNLGILYGGEGRYPEAEAQYLLSLARNPNDADACNNLGTIYFREQRYSQSIEQYERALRLAPSSRMAHENLGRAREMAKKSHEQL